MKFRVNKVGLIETFTVTRDNGEVLDLSWQEANFIRHEMEKVQWRTELSYWVDENIDNLDFSDMSKEEFIDECMDEIESMWENDTLGIEPDYDCIIFDTANANDMWEDYK